MAGAETRRVHRAWGAEAEPAMHHCFVHSAFVTLVLQSIVMNVSVCVSVSSVYSIRVRIP